jgi:hypothetical protein
MHSSNRTACPARQTVVASHRPLSGRAPAGIPGGVSGAWLEPVVRGDDGGAADHIQLRTAPADHVLLDRERALRLAEQLREWATGVPASAQGATVHFTSDAMAGGGVTDDIRVTPACGAGDQRSETLLKSAQPALVTCRLCRRTIQFRVASS